MNMIFKAYLQINKDTKAFIDINVSNAWYGFEALSVPTETFTYKDLMNGKVPITRGSVVVGGIGTVRQAVKRFGFQSPENFDYPEPLRSFLGREISVLTIAEVHAMCVDDKIPQPIFIKPVTGHKDFDGHIVSCFRDLIRTAGWLHQAPDTKVWVSEIRDFISEYRYFVNRGSVIGVGHYRGNPLVVPDTSKVQQAVDAWEDAPVSYTLDFGVTKEGSTLLVEANDGFSFGCYGLPAIKYARMLEDRWCEMVGQPLTFR